jgi:glycosyltransferase involved in cell wall biosynthesis
MNWPLHPNRPSGRDRGKRLDTLTATARPMSVSVILPNYNHAHWLPFALSALTRQDPRPAEILVVDDASTDDSVAIIKRFRAQYPFIQLLRHTVNKGAEAAVKTALPHITGEFLLFAAADDFVLPGLFARALPALRENPAAAFFCSEVVLIDRSSKIIGFRPVMIPRSTAGYISPNEVRQAIHNSDNWFIGTSVIYRRDRLAEIGFFDSTLATLQDAMATRLLAFRHGFYFTPEVLATWRVIPESLSVRSSLLMSDNEALLRKARAWIGTNFPTDIKDEYAGLFDRRLRFNFARSRIVWRDDQTDVQAIADIFNWGIFDRLVLRIASYLPHLSSKLILAWITIRVRPYGLWSMFSSWWRNVTVNRIRRKELTPILKNVPAPNQSTV